MNGESMRCTRGPDGSRVVAPLGCRPCIVEKTPRHLSLQAVFPSRVEASRGKVGRRLERELPHLIECHTVLLEVIRREIPNFLIEVIV